LFLAVLISACGTAGTGVSTAPDDAAPAAEVADGMIAELNFGGFGGGSNPQVNYNPFSPNALNASYIFEPLLVVNNYSCEMVPWLATDYTWQDPQTLTFTIRDGVSWHDGQPFTAEDVVFTYNLLKAAPAFDSSGLWRTLDSVTNEGSQVTFSFKEPAGNMLQRVASVVMVPKHVWETVEDPVTYVNEGAVGSGPFKPASVNGQQLVLERNADYWQADKVKVNRLVFTKNSGGNQTEQLLLSQGKYDTNAMFVPNIEQVYVQRDPEHHHYWYPPGGAISLGFNLTKAPFNDVEFRRAVAHAIDRESISTKAQFGYVETASQTGLVLPGQQDWLPSAIENEGKIPYDQARAEEILSAAGYSKDANGRLLNKDGQPIEFTFLVQNGWTDWIQAAQIIQQNLQALGMTVNVQTPAPENVDAQRGLGNFDMTFMVHGGSCSMYDNYYMFHSAQSAPIGEQTTTNYIRFEDPEVDAQIDALRQSPEPEVQKEAVSALSQLMVDKLPTVPLWYGAVWFQYSTKRAEGWPSAENPYAKPSDGLLIITNLRPSASAAAGS
jgi:peptide/nickel transport system substrate-binding protein